MPSTDAVPPPTSRGQHAEVRTSHVDGLRGLAAIWVVLFHAHEGGHLHALVATLPSGVVDVVFRAGYLGVVVFFVLSGFVMAHVVNDQPLGTHGALLFMGRRLVRLTPPMYASIGVVLALAWVKHRAIGGDFAWPSAATLLAHATYLHGVLAVPELSSVYWTLGIEVQFYAAFALLMVVVTSAKGQGRVNTLRAQLGFVLLVFTSLWPLGVLIQPGWTGSLLPYWYAFWLGACVRWRAHLAAFLPLALGLLWVSGLWLQKPTLVVAALTGWVLFEGVGTARLRALLSAPALLFVGMVSYSLYLLHNPVTGAAFNLMFRIVPRTPAGESVALVGVTAICLAVAYGAHWLVEVPSIRLSKRIR